MYGAHSYTDNIRYSNIDSIEDYIRNYEIGKQEDNIIIHEKQDKTAKIKEYMILGLRKIDGVYFNVFEQKFGFDLRLGFKEQLKKLYEQGLIDITNEKIYLTNKGIDFANIVWEEFI